MECRRCKHWKHSGKEGALWGDCMLLSPEYDWMTEYRGREYKLEVWSPQASSYDLDLNDMVIETHPMFGCVDFEEK